MNKNDILNWTPVSDDWGIIGYDWQCDCGEVISFASPGEECDSCDFVIPDIDPIDWYDEQMSKPVELRDWNRGA